MTNNDALAQKAAAAVVRLREAISGATGKYWAFTPAIKALLAERDADKKVIAESAVLFETLRQEVLALERDVDAANARVDTKCAQLCKQDEEIEMLRLRIAELEARTVTHDVGVMNIGNPYCEDHLVAWTVTGGQLAEGIYYLDARRVGDI